MQASPCRRPMQAAADGNGAWIVSTHPAQLGMAGNSRKWPALALRRAMGLLVGTVTGRSTPGRARCQPQLNRCGGLRTRAATGAAMRVRALEVDLGLLSSTAISRGSSSDRARFSTVTAVRVARIRELYRGIVSRCWLPGTAGARPSTAGYRWRGTGRVAGFRPARGPAACASRRPCQ
jgi:hypothetical protein